MAAKYVIHAYHGREPLLTLNLDSHWFRIPPEEPFEIDKDSNGRQLDNPEFYCHSLLAQFGGIYGIVEVPMTKTRTGIVLDVEGALASAKRTLELNRHKHINLWASEQMQHRVSKNLPVLPPTGFVEESIRVLGMDIGKVYNIHPVGWDFHPPSDQPASQSLPVPDEMVALRRENAELKTRLERIEALFPEEPVSSKKGKG